MISLTPSHRRSGLVALLAAGALALVAPSGALASHHLRFYKAESHLTMVSDDQDATVSCNPGDYALDGMWRIDHADQDDDNLAFPGPLVDSDGNEAVQVLAAYNTAFTTAFTTASSGNDPSSYYFHFQKNAIGTAQLKMWVTCVGAKTERSVPVTGHDHPVVLADAGTPTTSPASWTTATRAGAGPISQDATSCDTATKETVVAPSFAWTAGDGRVTKSTLTGTPADMAKWTWTFQATNSAANPAVAVGWMCLKLRVGPASAGTSKHKLIRRLATVQDPGGNVPTGSTAAPTFTNQLICSAHYKGLVGGFDATGAGLWYMGMDPRIKARAFRLLNTGAAQAAPLTLICLNDRTT